MRKLIELGTRIVGRVRRSRIVTLPAGKLVKVNLGCGLHVAPDWINIDGSLNAWIAERPGWFHRLAYRFSGARQFYSEENYCEVLGNHKFVHHELAYGVPLPDRSADFVFSCHFLEHLDRDVAFRLLKDCGRVLKQTGVLRIVVPDLEYVLALHGRGEKEEMLHYFFMQCDGSSYSHHRWMYDYEMMADTLKRAGFANIRRCQFQEGQTPDLKLLDNRAESSLFVEAEPGPG